MSESKRLYSFLLGVLLLTGISIAAIVVLQNQSQLDEGPEVRLQGTTTLNVTLSDMQQMDYITRNGSYQNSWGNVRGEGVYTGVRVSDLMDLVGGMNPDDNITVIGIDGYNQTFPYAKVYPNQTYYDIQGDMVIAFSFEGETVPDYLDGFRLMFLPEDGYYSNEDANATSAIGFSYAGPECVTNVVRIVLEGAQQPQLLESEFLQSNLIECSQNKLFLYSIERFEL